MSTQPNVYRTPRDPGFVGGYNLPGLAVGLLLLTFVNVAATQFVARRFEYQAALGRPLFRYGPHSVYQPFAWAVWLFRYGSSPDPRIRLPLLTGALVVVGGAVTTVLFVYWMNLSRAKRLSAGAEDLHGSARWATQSDIEETGLLDAQQGVYVGGWYDDTAHHLHYLRHDGPEHVLAFAPTRSGKGVGLVIPTLLAWSESAVIYDVKGENWAKTAGFRASRGHLCFKFSPVEVANGSRFNPLAEIRIGTLRDVSDAQNIAEILIRNGADSPPDPYWVETAVSLTVGLILHICYTAASSGRIACLANLVHSFTPEEETFRQSLAEIESYPHDPLHERGWHTSEGAQTATHPVVRERVRQMLEKEAKDFSGVLSAANTALALYCDPLVAANTSASDFTVDDLVNHARPVSLYLVVPNSDKERLRPLIRLIFTLIVNRLTERMDFEGAEQKTNLHRLLFMIDEFPSLKRMPVFADALSYMAGYGLKAFLITQDIRQIVGEYGAYESIVSNCHVRIAYAPNQYDTAELLSKMAGNKTIQKASFHFSGSRLAAIANHMSSSVDQVQRPLITPDEVMRLKPAKKRGRGAKQRIVAPGHMLIFTGGQYPIYGTQILYFKDPVLSKRAALPPPTEFNAIEDSAVIPQRRLDRTRNVISAPEPQHFPAKKPVRKMSAMEEAFWRELGDDAPISDEPLSATATGFIEQLDLDFYQDADAHQDTAPMKEDKSSSSCKRTVSN